MKPGLLKRFLCTALPCLALSLPVHAQTVFLDQGADWTPESRDRFYTQDQGSRLIPLAWIGALTIPTGDPFLHDGLARYGYLANPNGFDPRIPVGFTVAGSPDHLGMTCSACHTRQIEVNGTSYRVDGGPGIVDFQSFLADLNAAMATALANDSSFAAFADAVLGAGATDTAKAELRVAADLWHLRFDTIISRSLPDPAWGPSRLDAVSMIFNRVAGLDMGEPPDYIIADNIAAADAPTRYPFLWNAARQDRTQWPGFAENGTDLLGLARNLGEVYGVFGIFHPEVQSGPFRLNRNYVRVNSANFDGLRRLEDLIWKIGPPKWPWELDRGLAEQGKEIFDRDPENGGCKECHGIKRGNRLWTWATPVQDVGTDTAECRILARTVDTGVMNGARIPVIGVDLGARASAFDLLSASVIGAIIQDILSVGDQSTVALTAEPKLPIGVVDELKGAFRLDNPDALTAGGCAYEARVLEGIWAAAPYLHNGSVATLDDLLKPADQRRALFKVGPNYDIEAVGLSVEQDRFDYELQTTDCNDLDSGNSNCGHEYGIDLTDDDRRALLEYLKSL